MHCKLSIKARLICLSAFLFTATTMVSAERLDRDDVAGSSDHHLLSRYPDSVIVRFETRDFDELRLSTGRVISVDGKWRAEQGLDLEGRVTRLRYAAPKGRSTLEVFRNYHQALENAGFEVLFSCAREDCGGEMRQLSPPMPGDEYHTDLRGSEQRYLAVRGSSDEAEVHISVLVVHNDITWLQGHPVVQIDIVEGQAMATGLVEVTLDAQTIGHELSVAGRASIYGIHFDTARATLRPESGQQLEEIAKLLRQQQDLVLHVVGHTDNQGTFDYNLALSEQRAKAVVEALVHSYNTAPERLIANGVAFLAPVASNDTEQGRSLNRRVELVKR